VVDKPGRGSEQQGAGRERSCRLRRATPRYIKLATAPTLLFCTPIAIAPKIHCAIGCEVHLRWAWLAFAPLQKSVASIILWFVKGRIPRITRSVGFNNGLSNLKTSFSGTSIALSLSQKYADPHLGAFSYAASIGVNLRNDRASCVHAICQPCQARPNDSEECAAFALPIEKARSEAARPFSAGSEGGGALRQNSIQGEPNSLAPRLQRSSNSACRPPSCWSRACTDGDVPPIWLMRPTSGSAPPRTRAYRCVKRGHFIQLEKAYLWAGPPAGAAGDRCWEPGAG